MARMKGKAHFAVRRDDGRHAPILSEHTLQRRTHARFFTVAEQIEALREEQLALADAEKLRLAYREALLRAIECRRRVSALGA